MEIIKLLNSLRRLESEHIRLVSELALVNKPLAASMLNVGFSVIEGLSQFNHDELKSKLMGVFEINRKSILTINTPLTFKETPFNVDIRNDCIELTKVKANERKILVTLRELVLMDTDVAVAVSGIDYESAATLADTPADIVEEIVYANRLSGLLKLAIKDINGLQDFLKATRLSQAGIQFDRLISH